MHAYVYIYIYIHIHIYIYIHIHINIYNGGRRERGCHCLCFRVLRLPLLVRLFFVQRTSLRFTLMSRVPVRMHCLRFVDLDGSRKEIRMKRVRTR